MGSVLCTNYFLWTRREGFPLTVTVGGQKPLTITEREREIGKYDTLFEDAP